MKTQLLKHPMANTLLRLGAITCLSFGLIFDFMPGRIASASGSIIYVVPGGKGSGLCGTSWSDACDLHRALSIAATEASSTVTVQIEVEEGTYKPTGGTDQTLSWGLVNHVEIRGGYSWDGERADYDPGRYVTILSGDIGVAGASDDNSYHVVTADSGIDNTAVLDGFTISRGNATWLGFGGGVLINGGSPILSNDIFESNSAGYGGGLYNLGGSPILTDDIFHFNSGIYGGGMYNDSGTPILTDDTFSHNTASQDGAGLYSYNHLTTPLIPSFPVTDVTFTNNTAMGDGGGAFNDGTNPRLLFSNVTFDTNTAADGGGLKNVSGNPILTNVTFAANAATSFGGAVDDKTNSSALISDSIMWGDSAKTGDEIYNDATSAATVSYSDIYGGFAGSHNLNTDPLFGVLGQYSSSNWTFPLLPGSPVIDGGDKNCAAKDERGINRPQEKACDLGAFESQGFSLTITGGDQQAAHVGDAFAKPLLVTVISTSGEPVEGGAIRFFVTNGSTGAGATLTHDPATITSSAQADALATANGTTGTFTVTATANGVASPVVYHLSNFSEYMTYLPSIIK